MIWWFVRWILYGQRQRPFIGSRIKSGSSQWYWSLSDATLFWQRQGERKRQLLERYASDVGDDEILDLTLIRLWWFWPVVRFMSVSHAFLIQRCGCILGVQMRQMIFSLTYSFWKRNSSLSKNVGSKQFFCQGLLLEMFYWLIYLSTIIKNGHFLKMCSFLFNLAIFHWITTSANKQNLRTKTRGSPEVVGGGAMQENRSSKSILKGRWLSGKDQR